jgi:dienelactone hydrolase
MPAPCTLTKTLRDGCLTEHFSYDNGAGATVFGYFVTPPTVTTPLPAILYLHVHGGKYTLGKEELFQERTPHRVPALALTQAGYAVMAIDAYGFGERHSFGDESGNGVEQALYKHFLWQGSSLWGMMLRDDLMALDYLISRPEVDPQRIGITGMSLGGSRATWLAALDERPAAVVPVAQLTRWRNFAASGRYNGHSIYYYLPALLREGFDMEHLVALAAPRTQTILIGDQDPLSPLDGIQQVIAATEAVYRLYDAEQQLQAIVEPGVAHAYTPSMFAAMLATMKRALMP